MKSKMKYTAVIRTLGTAGEKYQQLLNSLQQQSIQPKDIIVYIAEGYPLPKETIGKERYVYVKKGMVAQRALHYDEVQTEYMLFLDDDLYLPPDFVEKMYLSLIGHKLDVISPDIYPNDKRPLKSELMMTISGRMSARRFDNVWGYKVKRTAGYSYNKNIKKTVYRSQTNAGACFFCKRDDFLKINFQEELWLDKMTYPIGEDQVMYYKMHLQGLRQATLYHSGIEHLDAGGNLDNIDKQRRIVGADYFFRMVFWHRFIQSPETNIVKRFWNRICIDYFFNFGLLVSFLKRDKETLRIKKQSIQEGLAFLQSEEYLSVPTINKI